MHGRGQKNRLDVVMVLEKQMFEYTRLKYTSWLKLWIFLSPFNLSDPDSVEEEIYYCFAQEVYQSNKQNYREFM